MIKASPDGDDNMGNMRVEKVELIKNNKVIYTHLEKTLAELFEYVEYEPLKGIAYEGGYFKNGKFEISSLKEIIK